MPDNPSLMEAKRLIERFLPDFKVKVLRELHGGRSGATVLLIDIERSGDPKKLTTTSPLDTGGYIAKLQDQNVWPGELEESIRHKNAFEKNDEFGRAHIPALRHSDTKDGVTLLMFEIAGQSLATFVAADTFDAAALRDYCGNAARDLLFQFNKQHSINQTTTANATLKCWLGYRLEAPTMQAFVESECDGKAVFRMADWVLVNPLFAATSNCIDVPAAQVSLDGTIHGDLHRGNIVVDRGLMQSDRYWLIDFALAMDGPIGFDQAYLELSILIGHLQGVEPQRILNILKALDSDDPVYASRVHVLDVGILAFCKDIRQAISEWQVAKEPRRFDHVEAQWLLARIAAGLNWMNKPLLDSDRRLALAYASLAATLYLERFNRNELTKLMTQQGQARRFSPPPVSPTWPDVWKQLERFDDTKAKYVLVTGRLDVSKELESLALIPWSAIVDLDPYSNEDGVHSAIVKTLASQRSVNQYGLSSIPMDVDRGTAWFMANGWPSRHEPVPESFRHWRYLYGDAVRKLLKEIQRVATPLPVKIVILASPTLDQLLLQSFIAAADEAFEASSSDITLISLTSPKSESVLKKHFHLAVDEFIDAVYQVFGASVQVDEPAIPSGDGMMPLSLDQLRSLEEDLDLLHSKVLTQAARSDEVADAFWKGNPPNWSDLYADVDVPRGIGPKLYEKVNDLLQARGNYTIELRHAPGSGGTTAARRCGWNLRQQFPVAVLRQFTETTADRIDQLFRISQKPVLLIAEAALLPLANREKLYHDIARRNVRCVILYVVRTFADSSDNSENYGSTNRLEIKDPMDDVETGEFLKEFSTRAKTSGRRKLLKELATLEQWKPYRNPFLFGLITYEEEFESVHSYVKHHLAAKLTEPVRQVVHFLALVTKYSQTGISIGLLNKLLDHDPVSDFDINKSLGEVIARLIVRRGTKVRLLHPVIAQEVLRQSVGGDDWKYGLKDLCLKFIRQTTELLGADAEETLHLFSELFIRRDYWRPSVRHHSNFSELILGRRNFSELILDIPVPAGQHAVFLALTETCPEEAHFWNHLGRHHIYEMKQDFKQAEQYLMKAVKLSEDEQVHHHSLGMVRRFWIRKLLEDMQQRELKPTPEQMIEEIQPLFAGAAEEFSIARKLSPEDNHGYITHIQLILEILEKLLLLEPELESEPETKTKKNISAILEKANIVGEWARKSIVVAEDLLRQVQHLREQEKPSRFERTCTNKLGLLYGHFDAVISSLEALSKSSQDPDVRRALATAYFSKSGRVWANLSDSELRRTKDLMENNLSADPTNDRDIRSWFQAYRRLPEFSYITAMDRLEGWAREANGLDAYYYLYILHFLRWRKGAERDENSMRVNLEQCRQRAIGKRGLSYEWLAKEPAWCPLANARELGEWDEFWTNAEPLQTVTGSIASIRPQAGTIRLGPQTVAYFVPGTKFLETSHLNALVKCYLGFSYDGLRAWSVELESKESVGTVGERAEIQRNVEGSTEPKSVMTQGASPRRKASAGTSDTVPDPASLASEVERFIQEQLETSNNQNKTLYLSALGNQLKKFGPQVHEKLGYKGLEDYLLTIPWLDVRGTGGSIHVVYANTKQNP